MHCDIMVNRGSSEEQNRLSPNPAAQAYSLLLSPEASEAFYSCLYQGFYDYKITNSAKRDGIRGQKRIGEENRLTEEYMVGYSVWLLEPN